MKKILKISILLIILGLIYNQTFIISVHADVKNEQDKEKQTLDIYRSLNEIVVLIDDKNLKVEDVKKWILNYEILV